MKAIKSILMTIAVVMGFAMCSCTGEMDEPMYPAEAKMAAPTEAIVTFTYKVPDEMFRYAEITMAYNNNENTDAKWGPMLDNTYTVSYDVKKFPCTLPVVAIYETTNRPAYNVNVDWDLTMDVEVTLIREGKSESYVHHCVYPVNGDLGACINRIIDTVTDRTYGVRIDKFGNIKYVN